MLTAPFGQQMDNVTHGIQHSIAPGPVNIVVRFDLKLEILKLSKVLTNNDKHYWLPVKM